MVVESLLWCSGSTERDNGAVVAADGVDGVQDAGECGDFFVAALEPDVVVGHGFAEAFLVRVLAALDEVAGFVALPEQSVSEGGVGDELRAGQAGVPLGACLAGREGAVAVGQDAVGATVQRQGFSVLGEPRWARLGIAAGSGALAAPKAEGGLDDRQAFHALMLLIRTGRRMNEVLMMDFEPLLPLLTAGKEDSQEPDGFVARLRYQQTKITAVIRRPFLWTRRSWTSFVSNNSGHGNSSPRTARRRTRTPAISSWGSRTTGSASAPMHRQLFTCDSAR